jgi:type VI secretion system lysozyme-like protein
MSLLDKLSGGTRRRSLLEAIVENLENVLNCKREYGSPLPGFGVRSLTEYTIRDHIAAAVVREVREAIEQYEPRLDLKDIKLEPNSGPFRLSFVITAAVRQEAQVLEVSFDTVFNNYSVGWG